VSSWAGGQRSAPQLSNHDPSIRQHPIDDIACAHSALADTASGCAGKSGQDGHGQAEFVPWQVGAVM